MPTLKLTTSGMISSITTAEADPLSVQVGGGHYKEFEIQPIEYCMRNGLDHCQSNIIKYVTRHKHKGGLQDLEKARHYIDLLIKFEYDRP